MDQAAEWRIGTQIANLDWLDIGQRYDQAHIFTYADP